MSTARLSRHALSLGAFLFLSLVLVYGAYRGGCSRPSRATVFPPFFALDTLVEVTLPRDGQANRRLGAVVWALEEAPRYLDVYSPTSEVSLAQRELERHGEAEVSERFFRYVSDYVRIAGQAPHALDPCMGDLIELWDFRAEGGRIAEAGALAERLAARREGFGLALRQADPARGLAPRLTLSPGPRKLHFGAILKGFAVDEAVDALRGDGVRSALVNAGGDLFALGAHPDGGPWRVGVQHPRRPLGVPLCVVALTDAALATSGDYQQAFFVDGLRYHHVLDPGSGMPARACLSASVRAPNTALADALATAAMVEGEPFLERLPRITDGLLLPKGSLDALLVLSDGRVVHSDGWRFLSPPPERVEVE